MSASRSTPRREPAATTWPGAARGNARRARWALAPAALLPLLVQASVAAPACGDALGKGVVRGESKRYVLAWRPDPSPIAVSRHFALDVAVCAKPGAAHAKSLRVDATMPAHRHGMNYRPTVAATGDGRFRAEGLLFHMPGTWEFAFDVTGDDGTERVRATYELR